MIIKVCGMLDPANIRQILALKIDWIGFVFYPDSPRYAGAYPSIEVIPQKQNIRRVGVFVDATREQMLETASRFRLELLQLHGRETPETCFMLRKRGYSVIKTFSVGKEEDLHVVNTYEGYADYFLFDTRCETYGGSGRTFDWSILQKYRGSTPFLLSGGISPEHLSAIRRFRHPMFAGIDLNSGFEEKPGFKHIEKLKAFIQQIRQPQ